MSDPEIRQAPGWWPSLVQVVHDECGYVGPTHDLNARLSETSVVRWERDDHECDEGWAR